MQVLCAKRWVAATVLIAKLPKHRFWEIALPVLWGRAVAQLAHLVSSGDVVTCPSLDMGILADGDHMGMYCS